LKAETFNDVRSPLPAVAGFQTFRSGRIYPFANKLGHVLLGHTGEGEHADGEITTRSLKEAEAEAVALLCCEALGLPGAGHCRGYIQSWWGIGNPIPENSARRVLRVADQILKAGHPEPEGGRP
jgi:hypothetical protein